ncbi:MAG: hypothetical protein ABIJ34_03920 [archaeon]
MEKKQSKLHGMTSDKASRVKTRGNRKEDIFARLINGMVFRGTEKSDVINPFRQLFSVKGSSEKQGGAGKDGRIQIFQYRKSRFEKEKDFPCGDAINKIFECYPPKYDEYVTSKSIVKRKIVGCMKKFKVTLLDEKNRKKFLERAVFDNNVDFLVIYDDDIFHIFHKVDVIDTFMKYLSVDNNSSFQKVVFKYKTLCMEVEMRTTNDGKYPTIFIPSTKSRLMALLTDNITPLKKFNNYIWLYKKAIKEYKHYEPKL